VGKEFESIIRRDHNGAILNLPDLLDANKVQQHLRTDGAGGRSHSSSSAERRGNAQGTRGGGAAGIPDGLKKAAKELNTASRAFLRQELESRLLGCST